MRALALVTLAALCTGSFGFLILPEYDWDDFLQQYFKLKTYKFSNCLPADKEVLVVNSLIMKPDPLPIAGSMGVSFNVTFKEKVFSPLEASVYMAKRHGTTYEKIPCNGVVGSCMYEDICAFLALFQQCPKPFREAGVPCKCPFEKGTYRLPLYTFSVTTPFLQPGDYHVRVNMNMVNKVVGCYDVHFSVSDGLA